MFDRIFNTMLDFGENLADRMVQYLSGLSRTTGIILIILMLILLWYLPNPLVDYAVRHKLYWMMG